jgi:hypothetical protein
MDSNAIWLKVQLQYDWKQLEIRQNNGIRNLKISLWQFQEEILNKLFINILWFHDTKIDELSGKKLNFINILKDKNHDLNHETDIIQ